MNAPDFFDIARDIDGWPTPPRGPCRRKPCAAASSIDGGNSSSASAATNIARMMKLGRTIMRLAGFDAAQKLMVSAPKSAAPPRP